MARYHYRIVNVFAGSAAAPFSGNPLCVFEDASGLDDATMLALARQFNLSETTFILPSARADARVRIFTPAAEMRFAGHPTLGSAQVVRELHGCGDTLALELGAGIVPVMAEGDHWTLVAPVAGAPAARPAGLADDVLAALMGLTAADLLAPPSWIDTGSEQLLVPLKTADAVRRAVPAAAMPAQWPANGAGRKTAYLFAFEDGDRRRVVARYFFVTASGGIAEDPGTGSACANLGGWLIATGKPLPAAVQVAQGDAIQRPCRLSLAVDGDGTIRVGGRVAAFGRGSVDL